jgi:hypothetical protein
MMMDDLFGLLLEEFFADVVSWLLQQFVVLLMRRWSLLVIGVLLTIGGVMLSLSSSWNWGLGLILVGLLCWLVALYRSRLLRRNRLHVGLDDTPPTVMSRAIDRKEASNPYQQPTHSFYQREEKPQNRHQFD